MLNRLRAKLDMGPRWLPVIAGLAVGALLGLLATAVVPRTYESQVKLFVNVSSSTTAADLQMSEEFAKSRAASYVEAVDSSAVLQPVVDQLQLDISPEELADRIIATNPPTTAIINITVRDSTAEQSARIADQTAQSLTNLSATLQGQPDPATSPVQVTILQRAAIQFSPTGPNLALNMLGGALVGTAFGAGIVLFRGSGSRQRPSVPEQTVAGRSSKFISREKLTTDDGWVSQ